MDRLDSLNSKSSAGPDKIYTSVSTDEVCESLSQRLAQFRTFEHSFMFTSVTKYFYCEATSSYFYSLSFAER